MEALSLLIILASGFMFTSRYPLARFKLKRSQGWILYLHLFGWGLLFACISFIFELLLLNTFSIDKFIQKYWIGSKFHEDFSIEFFIWSLFSVLSSMLVGLYYSKNQAASQRASKQCAEEDSFRSKCYHSAEHSELIQISLTNRKVYVGLVVACSELEEPNAKFIKIATFLSGYRDKENLIIHFTNNYWRQYSLIYSKVYKDAVQYSIKNKLEEDKKFIYQAKRLAESIEPFTVVIPISNIVSIANFNEEIFCGTNNNIATQNSHA